MAMGTLNMLNVWNDCFLPLTLGYVDNKDTYKVYHVSILCDLYVLDTEGMI